MNPIISTRMLRKEYGALVAVKDISLEVRRGHVLGLVGPNGAGKTTLLRMLATLLRPTRGTAKVLGYDVLEDYIKVRRRIGFMPDFFNLYNDITLEQCLAFFSASYRMPEETLSERIDSALKYVYLTEKRHVRIGHLSRGMTQRLGVACMLVHEPDLLLLDEPASGLDPKARIQLRHILQQLAEDGKTVLISSHILTELDELCSDLCIMHGGRIVERGSVKEVTHKVAGDGKVEVKITTAGVEAAELARSLEFVDNVEAQEGMLQVTMSIEFQAIAHLNRVLVEAGVGVSGLTVQKHNLESVFMEISQREEASHAE